MKLNLKPLQSLLGLFVSLLFTVTFSLSVNALPPGDNESPKENEGIIQLGAESQKPEDSFADGKLPRSLERMANQFHELISLVPAILANSAKINETVPVAVIDTGVDLAHPDLVGQLRYQLADGKIVGSGLDAMGSDNFASPNLVSPRLFAFGAKNIVDGKILGPLENPIEHLNELNDAFVKQFLASLAAHPVLKKSLFARKLNSKNFTLLGAYLFLENNAFDKMRYEAFKSAGLLLNETIRKRLPKATFQDKIHPLDLHYVVDQEWKLDPQNGLPFLPTINESPYARALLKVEHAEHFYNLLVQKFKQFAQNSGFQKSLQMFANYVVPREFSVLTSATSRINSLLHYLVSAQYYHSNGAQAVDPMVDTLKLLEQYVVMVNSRSGRVHANPLTIRKDKLADAMMVILNIQKMYYQMMSQFPAKSAVEERLVTKMLSKFDSVASLISWYFYDRTEVANSVSNDPGVPLLPGWDPKYRKLIHRTMHPYLGQVQPGTHGTHVAGIVAVQDPNISIEPVRVGLGPIAANPVEVDRLSQHFRKDFKRFLANPVIFRALASELSDHADELGLKDETIENRTKVAEYIGQVLESQINIIQQNSPSYFTFIGEIKRAIRHVGASKIPVVNLSLGSGFNDRLRRAAVQRGGRPDLVRDIESLFFRLLDEYKKQLIAYEIKKSAPDSIFVIAAGNSGAWIDSEAKGASPAELSSSFLARFEKPELGEVVVNNTLDNVIAVGSWSSKDRPSSYSNLLLGSRTPLVFIEGEHVLSAVRSVDPTSITQAIDERLPELGMIGAIGPTDRRFAQFWEGIYKGMGISINLKSEEDLREAEQFFKLSQRILNEAVNGLGLHLFTQFPDYRARLSGTSMAAPAVAGLIAKHIVEKAKDRNVKLSDVYGHVEFSPRAIIKEIIARSQKTTVAGNIQVSKLHGERFFDRTPVRESLDGFLDAAISDPTEFWEKNVKKLLPEQLIEFSDPTSHVDITDGRLGPLVNLPGVKAASKPGCDIHFGFIKSI
jgi:subtilisin family serine protease